MLQITRLIKLAFKEDIPTKDITSESVFGPLGAVKIGFINAKENLVISGIDLIKKVFHELNPQIKVELHVKDGKQVKKGTCIATVKGPITQLLSGERISLNFLQRLCGIATLTQKYVERIKPYRSKILDTRKTTPGMRWLEKQAVKDGGGQTHRMSLSDQFLIKDNHIAACGGVGPAIQQVKAYAQKNWGKNKKHPLIEVEVKNLLELKQALKEGVDIILLDNMNLSQIRKAVSITKNQALLEVSGGVNLRKVRQIASTGVSRISIGALTHSAPSADIHMLIED